MWIDRSEYERLVGAAANAAVLASQNAAHVATIDWLRLRLNQCEGERGALLAKVAGVAVNVPIVHDLGPRSPLQSKPDVPPNASSILDAMGAMFEDPGDEGAAKLGARHLDDGSVEYDAGII